LCFVFLNRFPHPIWEKMFQTPCTIYKLQSRINLGIFLKSILACIWEQSATMFSNDLITCITNWKGRFREQFRSVNYTCNYPKSSYTKDKLIHLKLSAACFYCCFGPDSKSIFWRVYMSLMHC
jgi:hypothetical protein